MASWHLNICKVKSWLSQEWKKLSKLKKKTFFLILQVLTFRLTKQTRKYVADTTVRSWDWWEVNSFFKKIWISLIGFFHIHTVSIGENDNLIAIYLNIIFLASSVHLELSIITNLKYQNIRVRSCNRHRISKKFLFCRCPLVGPILNLFLVRLLKMFWEIFKKLLKKLTLCSDKNIFI